MKLIIEDDEGHKTTVPFVREEITVGRQDGNTIRLTERNVSRKHARFFRKSGGVFVEDLRSHNGIKVNGDRIEAAIALKEGDLVQIGDYDLAVQDEQAATAPPNNRATVKMDALPDMAALDSLDNDSGATSRDIGREAAARASKALAASSDSDSEADFERDPSKPAAPAKGAQATAVVRMNGAAERAVMSPSPAPAGEDISPQDAPRLVMVSTELAGREFACLRTVLTIGRGDECDIPVDHRSLSRDHARLERRGSQWHVVDLGSANRVQVNGEEYAETALNSGDIITLGHVKLRFVAAGEEFTYAPEGSGGKRSPAVFVALGAVAVAVIGAGVYFGVLRKGPVEPVAPDNPKVTAPPPLVPKTDVKAIAATDSPPAATNPAPAAPPPPPKVTPEVPTPKASTDDVVVPDHVPAPDLTAVPEPKVHHDEPKHPAPIPPHLKPDAHTKVEKNPPAVAAADAAPTSKDLANQLRVEAEGLMQAGQNDVAIGKLRQALKLNGSDPVLHKELGACLANSGEMDDAAKEYQKFIELAPNSPDVAKVRAMLDAYKKSKGN